LCDRTGYTYDMNVYLTNKENLWSLMLQFVWKVESWATKCIWTHMFIPVWVRKWTVSWDESLDLYGHIWHLEIEISKTVQKVKIFLRSHTTEILKNCIDTQNIRWLSIYRLTNSLPLKIETKHSTQVSKRVNCTNSDIEKKNTVLTELML
jgi:hypothetical protein